MLYFRFDRSSNGLLVLLCLDENCLSFLHLLPIGGKITQGYGKRFLGENINFSISSYSVSRTFKANNDTLFEANRRFENGRNFM